MSALSISSRNMGSAPSRLLSPPPFSLSDSPTKDPGWMLFVSLRFLPVLRRVFIYFRAIMGGLEPQDRKGILIKPTSARDCNCNINQSSQMRWGLVNNLSKFDLEDAAFLIWNGSGCLVGLPVFKVYVQVCVHVVIFDESLYLVASFYRSHEQNTILPSLPALRMWTRCQEKWQEIRQTAIDHPKTSPLTSSLCRRCRCKAPRREKWSVLQKGGRFLPTHNSKLFQLCS